MDKFLSWLFSSAGSGWIFGVLSLTALIITRRKDIKPSRIVIEEKRRIEPIVVKKDIKNKISISYDGRKVDELGQIIVDIYNEGNKAITNPSLTIQFPEAIEILNGELVNSNSGTVEVDKNTASISFNFLNSIKEHRQVEQLSLVTSGVADKIKVNGGGEGWSIRHITLPTKEQVNKNAKMFLSGITILVIGMFFYGAWLDFAYGISMNEISIRAFIGYLPVFIPMVIWMIFGYKKLLKRS